MTFTNVILNRRQYVVGENSTEEMRSQSLQHNLHARVSDLIYAVVKFPFIGRSPSIWVNAYQLWGGYNACTRIVTTTTRKRNMHTAEIQGGPKIGTIFCTL